MNEVVIHQYAVTDLERMARAFAQSKLFGVTTPEQALALCLVAQAEGRHPASAANDYHIIQGRPSKKAEAMLRDFIAGGGKVEWHELTDAIADATFSHPSGGTVRIAWDMDRKKQAGINNPQWAKFPRQMLRSRCISEGVRTVYPAATSGMYEPEEVREFAPTPKEDLRDVTPTKTGKARKAASALEAARGPGTPEEGNDTAEPQNSAHGPENGHSVDLDEGLSDYADTVEFEIDTATDARKLHAWFNGEAMKTTEWMALREADPGRANALKAKASAKVQDLKVPA